MNITSVKVERRFGYDFVHVWVDGKLSGALMVDLGEGEKLAQLLRVKAMAAGQEPHWLAKDFNVLYRVAMQSIYHPSPETLKALGLQLERLKPAFTDTEEVRKWMRGEQ